MEAADMTISDDRGATFFDQLNEYIGRGDGPSYQSVVDPTVITRLTEAVGDTNPIYSDPTAAEKTVHGGVVAPVTALMCWTVRAKPAGRHGRDESGQRVFRLDPAPAGSAAVESDEEKASRANAEWGALKELGDMMKRAGYVAPAATDVWFEYKRYLKPGERLTISAPKIDAIAGPKKTSLGEGYFITDSQLITDAAGEVVAVMGHRLLRTDPTTRAQDSTAKTVPTQSTVTRDQPKHTSRRSISPDLTPASRLETVAVGDTLPELIVDITPTQIIAGAIASQDWAPVHHDRDFAVSMGHPDIFMNIMTSTSFVGRFITDWAGPGAAIEALGVRLGVPNYAYDTMVLSGEVTSLERFGDRIRVTAAVVGKNSIGNHITSNVTFTATEPVR